MAWQIFSEFETRYEVENTVHSETFEVLKKRDGASSMDEVLGPRYSQ
jgi:hypothetical protein